MGRDRRRVSPVTTGAARTQAVNETRNDTARINAARRAAAGLTYVNDNGFTVYVDTIDGTRVDRLLRRPPHTQDGIPPAGRPRRRRQRMGPIMRAFGQHYGIADAWIELSLHNRYKPIFEVGLGTARNTPAGMNFTYRSPPSACSSVSALTTTSSTTATPTTPSSPACATASPRSASPSTTLPSTTPTGKSQSPSISLAARHRRMVRVQPRPPRQDMGTRIGRMDNTLPHHTPRKPRLIRQTLVHPRLRRSQRRHQRQLLDSLHHTTPPSEQGSPLPTF